jgi:class 3 adenylate cyclase
MRAGLGTLGERWHRWWRAPSTLELLVGEEDYLRSTFRAYARFGLVLIPIVIGVLVAAPGTHLAALIPLAITFGFTLVLTSYFISRSSAIPIGVMYAIVIVMAGVTGVGIGVYDGRAIVVVAAAPAVTAVATVWVPRRWAVGALASGCTTYTATLLIRGAHPLGPRLIAVFGLSWLLLVELSHLLDRVRTLAERERDAKAEVERLAAEAGTARDQLAELNQTLEQRVEQQVDEIAGLGRLRRFLSPQIADAVVAADATTNGTDPLAPHRRQIAVVFCDLRGFTQFSNTSQPEEVLDVLEAYYSVVGGYVRDYEATVGSFLGDGIMAYFNDPLPCEDPAGLAVAMAGDLRGALDELCASWERRGYDLGFGMGIAYGYATLGTIGFEGRTDYTPVGSVVNLASRLSDEALRGEILLDGRAHAAVAGRVTARSRKLELKGFERAITAFALVNTDGLVPN